MKKTKRYYEDIYENRICNEYDHVLPVVADEGDGKSTFIVQSIILYRDIRGLDWQDEEAILEPLCYTREDVQERMANAGKRDIIAVPDAGRVLHKKEAMKGEQVEIEKDIADVRTKEFLFLLGFQSWSMIPSFMQDRRAKNAFYLPKRGLIRGYNRKSLNKKLDMDYDEWPRADLTDSFPSLDGTDIWERYKALDREMKEQRMAANSTEDEGEEKLSIQEIAADITDRGVDQVKSVHQGNKQEYIDADLIEIDYGISARKAKKVKKVLERDRGETTAEVPA